MKKFLLLPTMAVAAVLMLNSCELFCEQICDPECQEAFTSIMVSLQPFTVPGTRATGGVQTKSVTDDAGNQTINEGDEVLAMPVSEEPERDSLRGIPRKMRAFSSGNPSEFKVEEGQPGVSNGSIVVMPPSVGGSLENMERLLKEQGKIEVPVNDAIKKVIIEILNNTGGSSTDIDLSGALSKLGLIQGGSAALANLGALLGISLNSDVAAIIKRITITADMFVFGDYYVLLDDIKNGDIILHYSGDRSNSFTFDFGEGLQLWSEETKLWSEETKFKFPITTIEPLHVEISIEAILAGSPEIKTYIIPGSYEVSSGTLSIAQDANLANLESFINLSGWNPVTEKYYHSDSYQIQARPESYCFDATVVGNNERIIFPTSVSVISQQPASSIDGGDATPGDVVTDVALLGGKVTFRSTGIPGTAEIRASADGVFLTSWTIECAPR